MSENQHIDPALLDDANPTGLKPGDAVNGGLNLREKPRGIRKINKKGIMVGAGIIGVAAIVASTTFNQAGSAAAGAAKDVAANQGKNNRPPELKRDNLWYAQVPDKVATPDMPTGAGSMNPPAGGPTLAGTAATPASTDGTTVPDLTGKAVSPLAAATQGKVGAQPLQTTSAAGAGNSPAQQAAQAAAQQRQQAEQRQQQALTQALNSGLAASGFGNEQKGNAGAPTATPTTAGGIMPASYAPAAMPGRGGEDDQNKQDRKDKFLETAKQGIDRDYSPSRKTAPRSRYELKASSVIPAVMISGINSDLPGQVIAQVRENVLDTKTGQFVLIPQGSRLVGLYDAHVAYGQKRILLAWNRIIFPDGSSFDLKGMPGADKSGYAGFFDEVDNHYLKIFGSSVLMSLISAGVQLSQPNNGSNNNNNNNTPSVSQTLSAALGQQIGQTSMTITQKNLNIQPTLEVRPGYQFNVMVTADMILPPAGQ